MENAAGLSKTTPENLAPSFVFPYNVLPHHSFYNMASKRYSVTNRLADVLALIQVLALNAFAYRSESDLQKELQGIPKSAGEWTTVAVDHPEFFRVDINDVRSISLVARHANPQEHSQLSSDLIGKLLNAAIHLHDREIGRRAMWRSVGPTLLGVLLGGVLAFGTSYWSVKFQLENQLAIQKAQDARAVYSRLMGHRIILRQILVNAYESRVNAYTHDARWALDGYSKDSINLHEAQRWFRRTDDLALISGKNYQAFFEDLGLVQATFSNSPKLKQLIDRVMVSEGMVIEKPPKGLDVQALNKWQNKKLVQVGLAVKSELTTPLGDLLDYLSEQLSKAPPS